MGVRERAHNEGGVCWTTNDSNYDGEICYYGSVVVLLERPWQERLKKGMPKCRYVAFFSDIWEWETVISLLDGHSMAWDM